ncbi:hypothetical protein DNX69_20135 [Rhodopseudomonas palustris]|uniref:Uncharacterized protein n=1 Tax=Rhodopseudomonas palustris TaxID=1076 RepID=A0A323UCL4_RHOPL|nr:hypothetical protein [Rhodopseudomonas palustris]PZA10131.1 hypothetical protein DNX69_20135 [Rhodopseudomonas palustris]
MAAEIVGSSVKLGVHQGFLMETSGSNDLSEIDVARLTIEQARSLARDIRDRFGFTSLVLESDSLTPSVGSAVAIDVQIRNALVGQLGHALASEHASGAAGVNAGEAFAVAPSSARPSPVFEATDLEDMDGSNADWQEVKIEALKILGADLLDSPFSHLAYLRERLKPVIDRGALEP